MNQQGFFFKRWVEQSIFIHMCNHFLGNSYLSGNTLLREVLVSKAWPCTGSHNQARKLKVLLRVHDNCLRGQIQDHWCTWDQAGKKPSGWGKPLLVRNFSWGGRAHWKFNGKVPSSTFMWRKREKPNSRLVFLGGNFTVGPFPGFSSSCLYLPVHHAFSLHSLWHIFSGLAGRGSSSAD